MFAQIDFQFNLGDSDESEGDYETTPTPQTPKTAELLDKAFNQIRLALRFKKEGALRKTLIW